MTGAVIKIWFMSEDQEAFTKEMRLQVSNVYQLMHTHHLGRILAERRCVERVREMLSSLRELQPTPGPDLAIHTVKRKHLQNATARRHIILETLDEEYDIMFVTQESFRAYVSLYHKCTWIFILDGEAEMDTYIPYSCVAHTSEGTLYLNEFKSIQMQKLTLNYFEQTYVRDKPFRFLKKTCALFRSLNMRTIVEIGSCRQRLNHKITETHPNCCNDGHSTFFWCAIPKAHVHTVDTNPACELVFKKASDEGLINDSSMDIYIMDGLQFLKEYRDGRRRDEESTENSSGSETDGTEVDENEERANIDLLYLDAWDVVPQDDTSARKHLEAYRLAKPMLAATCMVSIDQTDIASGGKGKLLIRKLLKDGFIILYKGRQCIFYRGNVDRLFRQRSSSGSSAM